MAKLSSKLPHSRILWIVVGAAIGLSCVLAGNHARFTSRAMADQPEVNSAPADYKNTERMPMMNFCAMRPVDLYLSVEDLKAGKPSVAHVVFDVFVATGNGQDYVAFRTDQKTYLAINPRQIVAISAAQ